jgi:hypothetical protein
MRIPEAVSSDAASPATWPTACGSLTTRLQRDTQRASSFLPRHRRRQIDGPKATVVCDRCSLLTDVSLTDRSHTVKRIRCAVCKDPPARSCGTFKVNRLPMAADRDAAYNALIEAGRE